MERVDIIGVPISAVNMDSCIDYIFRNWSDAVGNYICVSNVHTTVMAHDNPEYKAVQSNSFLSVPDGKPLSMIGRKIYPEMDRVTGPDLMRRMFDESKKRRIKHFIYGNTLENLNYFLDFVHKEYPWVEIVGYMPSKFRDLTVEEEEELKQTILDADPDFIWVSLGAPKQEYFCSRHKDCFPGVMVGIGGALNVISGKIPEAPMWMQNMCLEWFYRFLQEPKRLFKRYFVTNSKFIWYHLLKK